MTTVSALSPTTTSTASTTATTGDEASLGQEDFLTLMTAQLQNQDPFEPMDNAEFLSQMAQFSTVEGIESLNETVDDISAMLGGNNLGEAATMLGRQVLVPGTVTRPDDQGEIRAAAELQNAASDVTIRYSDAETFETLHIQELGAQPSGRMEIAWSDPPADITSGRRPVRISIESESAGAIDPYVYSRVEGVRMPEFEGGDLVYNVEGYGLVSSLEIETIR